MRKWMGVLCLLLVLPLVSAAIPDDIRELEDELNEFVAGDDIILVEGDHITPTVKMFLKMAPEILPEVATIPRYHEDDITPELIEGKTVLLIGGPRANTLSASALETGERTDNDVQFGKIIFVDDNGQKSIVVADAKEFDNLERHVDKSPLSNIIPEAYVPAAATAIGFSLLMLWQLFGKLAWKVVRQIIASKIMKRVKKKEVKGKYLGFRVFGIRWKLRELFAVCAAAAILAMAVAYGYLEPGMNTLKFLGMVILVNIVIYGFKHGARLLLDKHHEWHTEFVLWPWGVLVTALTGWFGSTFSLAGYVTVKDKTDKVHEGQVAFKVSMITQNAFVIFWVWNFFAPAPVIQMGMLMALTLTYVQMLPIAPFDGKKIYAWKPWKWWSTFIPLTAVYIFVNLYVY